MAESKHPPFRSEEAREKFATHFLTFWHLIHLASFGLELKSKFRTGQEMTKAGGKIWTRNFSKYEFSTFDGEFDKEFKFIENKFRQLNRADDWSSRGLTEQAQIEEKALMIITDYDKCLNIVRTFDCREMDENLNPTEVCLAMSRRIRLLKIDIFLSGPILWTSLIVMWFYQLLLFAKDCVVDDKKNLYRLQEITRQHAQLIERLQTHFQSGKVGEGSSWKYFEAVVSQDELISIFNKNATCTAKQIPTALTAIIRDYCSSDPFSLDDADTIQAKIIQLDEKAV